MWKPSIIGLGDKRHLSFESVFEFEGMENYFTIALSGVLKISAVLDSEDRVSLRIVSLGKLFQQSTLLLAQYIKFSYSPKQE